MKSGRLVVIAYFATTGIIKLYCRGSAHAIIRYLEQEVICMESHINNYLEWLRKNMKEETLPNGVVEITTPFLDRHNDYTQIYLQKLEDGNYRVTDLGYTVDDLEMCGVDITTGKRYEILRRTLNVMGAQFDNKSKELYIECDGSKLAEAQHALIQCMLDVNVTAM